MRHITQIKSTKEKCFKSGKNTEDGNGSADEENADDDND